MGIKDKFEEYQMENFLEQHGDRLTPVYGNVLSVKVDREKKFFLWHVMNASVVVKPMGAKHVVRCQYKKSGFKMPEFINVRQGNEVLIQGMKGERGKEASEVVKIMNLVNITDRTQLVEGQVSVDEVIESIKSSTKMSRRRK